MRVFEPMALGLWSCTPLLISKNLHHVVIEICCKQHIINIPATHADEQSASDNPAFIINNVIFGQLCNTWVFIYNNIYNIYHRRLLNFTEKNNKKNHLNISQIYRKHFTCFSERVIMTGYPLVGIKLFIVMFSFN